MYMYIEGGKKIAEMSLLTFKRANAKQRIEGLLWTYVLHIPHCTSLIRPLPHLVKSRPRFKPRAASLCHAFLLPVVPLLIKELSYPSFQNPKTTRRPFKNIPAFAIFQTCQPRFLPLNK